MNICLKNPANLLKVVPKEIENILFLKNEYIKLDKFFIELFIFDYIDLLFIFKNE